jgi:hypothetical protein
LSIVDDTRTGVPVGIQAKLIKKETLARQIRSAKKQERNASAEPQNCNFGVGITCAHTFAQRHLRMRHLRMDICT